MAVVYRNYFLLKQLHVCYHLCVIIVLEEEYIGQLWNMYVQHHIICDTYVNHMYQPSTHRAVEYVLEKWRDDRACSSKVQAVQ